MQGNIVRGAFVALCLCVGIASAKPSAPLDVRVETRPLGGTAYEVTLVVTARKNVKGLVLELDGRRVQVGALAAGQTRTTSTRIVLGAGGGGKDVVGSAAVDVGGHRRRAAAVARVGVPEAVQPAVNIVRLPDGTEAAEVRP